MDGRNHQLAGCYTDDVHHLYLNFLSERRGPTCKFFWDEILAREQGGPFFRLT